MKEDYPNRKPLRMRGYDYSQNGAYFITVCTKNREEMLCTIKTVNNHKFNVGDDACIVPPTQVFYPNENCALNLIPSTWLENHIDYSLTPQGKIIDKVIGDITGMYPDICIDTYVIMPNHIHLIIRIDVTKRTDELSPVSGTMQASSPTKMSVPKLVAILKRYCTYYIGYPVFQRSYHDHIIRNVEEYNKITEYILQNPFCWEQDCFYIN